MIGNSPEPRSFQLYGPFLYHRLYRLLRMLFDWSKVNMVKKLLTCSTVRYHSG
ncbi:hypothetical protein Hanom_Chr17g01578661 [Helianthus anomalus]